MSRHPSFGRSGATVKKKNVLKRFDRIKILRAQGKWKEGVNKVTNLPKTQVKF